ncbi:MAG TPA: hypothetical protein VIG73_10550 [Cerasibacillus sp.]|uniref:HAAS domain-containing protein n=1 Tax=Cerasibacillus sp. TaxID=2498711 RepID=UPI002F42D24B
MTNPQLSKKSNKFLEDLRAYLFAKGKKFEEIKEITNELEMHLLEAEKNGKPIEKIVGNSPAEYMEMISKEMDIDVSGWFKYILLIIIGSFTFKIFSDVSKGELAYSVFEIVGHIADSILFIILLFAAVKFISKRQLSDTKAILIVTPIILIEMGIFVGIIYFNNRIDSPMIHFGETGTWLAVALSAILIIGMTLWAKTSVLVVVLLLLFLPDYLLSFTSLQLEMQLIISLLITYGGIALYLWLVFPKEK